MSEVNIYNCLRIGGLSPAGACAMMGNWQAESGCISYRIQGDFSKNYDKSKEYTAQVDNEIISGDDFVYRGPNGGGYGLAQWTLHSRKKNLYAFAKGSSASIGDEVMQSYFCINELQIEPEYAALYSYLCKTDNLAEATEKICLQYERPAVPNIAERHQYAKEFYSKVALLEQALVVETPVEESPIAETPALQKPESCQIEMRVIRRGDLGHDVFVAQCGLFDLGFDCDLLDGDFGPKTEQAVMAFQQHYKFATTGVISEQEWNLILNNNLEV